MYRLLSIAVAIFATWLAPDSFAEEVPKRAACLAPTACDPSRGYYDLGALGVYPTLEAAVDVWRIPHFPPAAAPFPDHDVCSIDRAQHLAHISPTCPTGGIHFNFSSQFRSGCPATDAGGSAAVDPAAGNHYQVEIDYQGGIPLTRYYNSGTALAKGGFGMRWQHHFDRTAKFDTADPQVAHVTRHTGQRITFRLDANGLWKPDEGDDFLVHIPNNKWYSWVYGNAGIGVVELYDVSGRLAHLSSNGGDVFQFMTYNGSNLTQVSDAWGRVLQFDYDGAGRIIKATTPSGAAIWYDYDASDNLVTVTYPTGLIRRYTYDEPDRVAGAAPSHALTGIIDNDARVADISYEQGRSVPQNTDGDYIWQTPETFSATLVWLQVIPRPVAPPSGTMGVHQPPRNHAVPVPPGSGDRPTERPDRPGAPSTGGHTKTSNARAMRCDAAAQKCLTYIGSKLKLKDFKDPRPGTGETGSISSGQCAAPRITSGEMRCLSYWTFCLQDPNATVQFTDGTVVYPD